MFRFIPILILALLVSGCAAHHQQQFREHRGQIISANDWDDDTTRTIRMGKIREGFSPDMVRAAFGDPYRVNTHAGQYGAGEQWVYGYMDYYYNFQPTEYVYFEGGEVTGWQALDR